MVHQVSAYDGAKVSRAKQEAYREAMMHEPVVNDEVSETEERHAEAGTEDDLSRHGGRRDAPVEDERDGEGRVRHAKHVVGFEAAAPRLVVRRVDEPQGPVPNATVKERGPQVHGQRGRERRGDEDKGMHQAGAHVTSVAL